MKNEPTIIEIGRTGKTLLGVVWALSGLCWLGNGNLLMIAAWVGLLIAWKKFRRDKPDTI